MTPSITSCSPSTTRVACSASGVGGAAGSAAAPLRQQQGHRGRGAETLRTTRQTSMCRSSLRLEIQVPFLANARNGAPQSNGLGSAVRDERARESARSVLAQHEARERGAERFRVVDHHRVTGASRRRRAAVPEHVLDHPIRDVGRQHVARGAAHDERGAGNVARARPTCRASAVLARVHRFGVRARVACAA